VFVSVFVFPCSIFLLITRKKSYRFPLSAKGVIGVRLGCCSSPIPFNLHMEYITKETVEGFGNFKIV